MSYYYRGKVKTPLFPVNDRFAIVQSEEQPSSRKEGINLDGILKCLMKYCDNDEPGRIQGVLVEQLKLNYQTLIKSYEEVLSVS